MTVPNEDFTQWFDSLPEGRQNILKGDKWLFAEAAFNAGKEFSDLLGRIVTMIVEYGAIDGAHHKQWVLDQCLRLAAGDGYQKMIALYSVEGDVWDRGIAP